MDAKPGETPQQSRRERPSLPTPAAWVAAFLVGGMLLASGVRAGVWVGVVVAAGALVGAWAGERARSILLAVAVVAVGFSLGEVALYRVGADDVSWFVGREPALVRVVTGPLEGIRLGGRRGSGLVADAEVRGLVADSGAVAAASGKLRVKVTGDERDLPGAGGDGELEIVGMLAATRPPMNPGEADVRVFDALDGVRGELEVVSTAQIRPRDDGRGGGGVLKAWRRWTRERLAAGFHGETPSLLLLKSLLLGDTERGIEGVREDFQRTGTTHHLAVSGTHLAVVGGAVYGLLRVAMLIPWLGGFITPRRSMVLALAVLLAYGAAVVPGPPVTRSLMLAVVASAGLLTRRPVSIPNLLGVCCIVMLAVDPRVALMPGFQLTFFVVWAILVVGPGLGRFVGEYRDFDFVVADRWQPNTRGARWRRRKWKLIGGGAVALVAFAAAGPIVACHFSQANPYAAAASVVLAPVVFAALLAAGAKVLVSGVLPFADPASAAVAEFFAGVLSRSVHWLAALPGSAVGVPALPGYWAVGAAVLLAVPCLPVWRTRKMRAFAWSVAMAGVLAVPYLPRAVSHREAGLTVNVLSVGNAQTVVVRVNGEPMMLIDAGAPTIASGEQTFQRVLEPFFREANERRIGILILTHTDAGSTSAAPAVVEQFGVGELMVTPGTTDDELGPFAKARSLAAEARLPVRVLAKGDVMRVGKLTIDVLYPGAAVGRADGVVLRLTYEGRTMIICSSLSGAGEMELVAHPEALRADVLVLPNHGQWSPGLEKLMAASEAGTVIVSDDDSPTNAQRKTLDLRISRYLRTSQQGAVTVSVLPDGSMSVRKFLRQRRGRN